MPLGDPFKDCEPIKADPKLPADNTTLYQGVKQDARVRPGLLVTAIQGRSTAGLPAAKVLTEGRMGPPPVGIGPPRDGAIWP